ncbi:MAG: type II toxin-antitoxin system PemK/MazF family toxin [Sinobacteraceae bacterium]|nr:type II toxin-antitoxin system PemK/MazF family toxin [Nevskia sp.]MDI3260819.1 type II toxin-antitoxin system PemK/MazF family toxin [Nevskiaceae bacterium]
MPSFEPGHVVKVPFPYTDRATRQRRPALVVSVARLAEDHGLLWVLMITSAENRRWPDDIEITALAQAGLPAASVIRPAKIATIESRDAEPLGRIGVAVLAKVRSHLARTLGLS